MINEALERAAVGEAGLSLAPKILRQEMQNDPDFLKSFGLSLHAEGTITFGSGPQFTASELYALITKIEDGRKPLPLNDEKGKQWSVSIEADGDGCKFLRFAENNNSIDWLEGALLLKDEDARQHAFRRLAKNVALPEKDKLRWKNILSKQPASNNEMSDLIENIYDTPIRFIDSLNVSLRLGETPVELFIPRNKRYYERLIGDIGEASTLYEHAKNGVLNNIKRLITWDQRDGLLLALVTASHSEFISVISLKDIAKDNAIEVFDLLVECGDMISRLGAIQMALPLLTDRPELVSSVEKLINIICVEDPETNTDGYSDLCRLFIFVESEISRLGILRDDPPFFRRMASFAQASLIQRQFLIEGVDLTEFRKWVDKGFGPQFYAQSLVDMRSAPRWHPELIHPKQLKQEFIGRLLGTGETFKEQVKKANLTDFFSSNSESEGSLSSVADFPKPFFPGPLEGNLPQSQSIPDELFAIINEQLNEPKLSSKSFIAAVNLANIFMIEADLAIRISELLKKGRYHLHKIDDVEELVAILSGLARIAAVTRSIALSQDVRILVQKYRSNSSLRIPISSVYSILFIAASAHVEVADWCVFIGDSLSQLAFSSLTKDEAGELHALIRYVCKAEPELWTTIGIADAALSAFIES